MIRFTLALKQTNPYKFEHVEIDLEISEEAIAYQPKMIEQVFQEAAIKLYNQIKEAK